MPYHVWFFLLGGGEEEPGRVLLTCSVHGDTGEAKGSIDGVASHADLTDTTTSTSSPTRPGA